MPIKQDCPLLWQIKTLDQPKNRAFTSAGGADQCQSCPRFDIQRNILKHPCRLGSVVCAILQVQELWAVVADLIGGGGWWCACQSRVHSWLAGTLSPC